MIKRQIIKALDKIVGRPLVYALGMCKKRSEVSPCPRPARILIIRPGGIGDAVLSIPLIKEIRQKYPNAVMDVLAEKRNGALYKACTEVDHTFWYDKPGDLWKVLRTEYDVIIDTEQWHRLSAVIASVVKSKMTIGYATNERKMLFTHPVTYSHNDHEIESFFHLTEPLTHTKEHCIASRYLILPEGTSRSIDHYLVTLEGRKFITVFPGGSIAAKQWGADNFHEVAKRLALRGFGIIIVGDSGDRKTGDRIVKDIASAANLCGELSLLKTAAVLDKTSLLISGDSGIMHLASALGIPVVALFGPSNAKKWAPRSKGTVVVSKAYACSPCSKYGYTPRCKKNVVCIRNISIEEVCTKALAALEGQVCLS